MFQQLYEKPGELGFEVAYVSDKIYGKKRFDEKKKRQRVCLVSDTSAKMPPTADQTARWLAQDGWDVTLLDLSTYKQAPAEPAPYAYQILPGLFGDTNWYTPMQSLCAYHWLKDKKFDLIIFQHSFGAGFFTCEARKMRLAFEKTPVIVMPDFPYCFWLETANRTITFIRMEAEIDYMEKAVVERADGILFTNKKVLDWMVDARWPLGKDPQRVAVLGEDKGAPFGTWLADKTKNGTVKLPLKASDIKISVCVSSYNRPHHLRETVRGLLAQTCKDFEVIVVNTTDPGVEDPYEEFRAVFEKRKWKWARQPKRGLGAACNYGASLATGTHLLFKDDDNHAMPDEIEYWAKAARSGADVYMCVFGKHPLSDNATHALAKFPARPGTGVDHQALEHIHFGPVLINGLLYNTFGDANSLMKKSCFDAIGGFGEKKDTIFECPDWETHGRAAMAGFTFASIPEILLLYRVHVNGGGREDIFRKILTALRRIYAPHVPEFLYPILLGGISDIDGKGRLYPGRYPNPVAHPDVAERIGTHRAFALPDVTKSTPKVAFAVTDTYMRQACAMVASLLTSAKGPVDIYAISAMSAKNNAALKAVAAHYGARINILPYRSYDDKRMPRTELHMDDGPGALFWHFLLPEYLPNLDRVIAIDCDMLVRHDLEKLWQTDLEDNIAGAVNDRRYAGRPFVQKFKGGYLHPGVMLIDLKQWRKNDITKRCFAAVGPYESRQDIEQIWEQSPLNAALDKRWKKINPVWNWLDHAGLPGKHELDSMHVDAKEYELLIRDPAICRIEMLPKSWTPHEWKRGHFSTEFNVYLKHVDAVLESAALEKRMAA